MLDVPDASGKVKTLNHLEFNVLWSANAEQAEAAVGLGVLATPAACARAWPSSGSRIPRPGWRYVR
ncbi:MAG TPA: hypothetical protein VGI66_00415 [Streptosporangiaceae bacterium]